MLNILNKILTQNKTSNTKKNQGIEETELFKNPSNLDEYKDKKLIDTIISTEKKENSNLNDLDDVIYKAKISKYQLDKDVILSKITRNELEESLAKIQFHKIIYVAAPETIPIKRIEARDGLDKISIQQRMDKQWPDEKKSAVSDYIIHNDELQLFIPQVLSIREKLTRI